MKKNKKLLVIIGLVALVVCLSLALIFGLFFRNGGGSDTTPTTGTDPVAHTVSVSTDNGFPLKEVGVYVYTDSTCQELVWFAKTDNDGKMTFTEVESDSYVAVLEGIPTGYKVEDYYLLTGVETNIVLSVGQMTEEDMQTLTYKLGDAVMDFSVTAVDGTVYTLSELLVEKQAVVLNFWFINCQPCLMEFPYLQEAYAEYSDDIAVIAMNPVDKMADVLAFQTEHGYAFPIASVDEAWIKIMQVTAFPTTVVIDRFGNITLMHTGSIDNAQTFKDVFAYFCAEEYEQKFFTDISELETEKEEGSEENPTELGGVESFDVTVAPGQVYYTELFRLTDMYLTIYSKDAYVLYNDKKYEPNNGVISILMSCPDMYTPIKVGIGNSSDKEQTFTVYLVPKLGSFNNPYNLTMGEFTASVSAGNETGIYYLYTATEDGVLTIKCLSATAGVKYSYYLYNLDSYAMRNLEEDGQSGEDGVKYISVQAKKGQKIQFSIGTLPDETNSYPAGKFQMLASFDNGAVVETGRLLNEEITYTVTLKDQNGDPVADASVYFSGEVFAMYATETEAAVTEEVSQYVTTDASGVATLSHYPGSLKAQIRIPDGYTLDVTTYPLTEETPVAIVQLHKIIYKDYSIQIQTPEGDPVKDMILIAGNGVAFSNAEGKAVFKLPEGTYNVLVLGVPAGYILEQNSYEMTAENTQLSVALGYEPGHEQNPIVINHEASFMAQAVKASGAKYYTVHDGGATSMSMTIGNGYITVNGTQYDPDVDGVITVDLTAVDDTFGLVLFNNETVARDISVKFKFPQGTKYNPSTWILTIGSSVTLNEPGEELYIATSGGATTTDGYLDVTVSAKTFVGYDVIVSNGRQTVKMSDGHEDGKFRFNFTGNAQIVAHIVANEELSGSVKVTVKGKIVRNTGTSYSVTVVNADGDPIPGVPLQFMKDDVAASDILSTDTAGKAQVALTTDAYDVKLVGGFDYDASLAKVTAASKDLTIVAQRIEDAVAEGMTRYTVTITDFNDNLIGDHVLLFMQDGLPVGYNIIEGAGGVTTLDLPTGTYQIQMVCLGETKYYFESTKAVVTEESPSLTLQAAAASTATPEENWKLSQITPVGLGGTYVTLQKDVATYFSFSPTKQGVYRITVTDPDAVLRYWGSVNYPFDVSGQLEDYTKHSFTISVNTNALGQNHAIGIYGTEDSLIIITREGDAVEDIPYTEYVATKAPVAQTLASGLNFTRFDLTKPTNTYNLVLNTNDGFYHLGSADGPVVYVQLTYDANDQGAPYITLYDMVGGVGNTGTALRCHYTDGAGNEVREDYTTCMLEYGACADQTYGVYPLTEDLKYMIQMGGQHQGWWDANNVKGNLLFTSGENLEIGWMFALCYLAN